MAVKAAPARNRTPQPSPASAPEGQQSAAPTLFSPELQKKCVELLRARELGRRHYAKSDRLLNEIRTGAGVGVLIPISAGKHARVKDLYANQDKVFRSHGIGRYELEVVEG